MEKPAFNVAVVGGGIAGLAFALALSRSRSDVAIDIYEAAASFSEFGAGLNMWPRVVEVLHSFGLEETLRAYAGTPEQAKGMQFRKADEKGGIVWGENAVSVQGIHRAHLLEILVEHTVTLCQTHFSKKLASYDDAPDGPVALRFADSSTATCDLLVGADGVKSAVRAHMYNQMADKMQSEGCSDEKVISMRKHAKPAWSGCFVYRNLITREELEKVSPGHVCFERPICFQGKSQNLITYPISQGRWINAAVNVVNHDLYGTYYDGPWVLRTTHEELAQHFVGWDDPVQDIIKLMGEPTRWVANIVPDLPTFASGRVVLMGDAAHSMTPYQAAGAMQAIEDGYVLSALLSHPETTLRNIPLVLQVYDEVRRPIAQEFSRRSLLTGQTLLLEKMEGVTKEISAAGLVSKEKLLGLREQLSDLFQWTQATSADRDREMALEIFESRVRG